MKRFLIGLTVLSVLSTSASAVSMSWVSSKLFGDGTREETCSSFEGVLNLLEDWEIELPVNPDDYSEETITDFLDAIEPAWHERFNDGGGSAWITY